MGNFFMQITITFVEIYYLSKNADFYPNGLNCKNLVFCMKKFTNDNNNIEFEKQQNSKNSKMVVISVEVNF